MSLLIDNISIRKCSTTNHFSISNAIAAVLQPSIYDSIIMIKKLPFLPDLLPSSSEMYNIKVEDFMLSDVKHIWRDMTYQDLKTILRQNKQLKSFPLVDSDENMILLGSVRRCELIKLILKQIGREKRLEIAAKWKKDADEQTKLEESQKVEMSRFSVDPTQSSVRPPKLVLIRSNSLTMKDRSSPSTPHSPFHATYLTITGAENRIRSAFDVIFRRSHTYQDVNDPEIGYGPANNAKKVQLPHERVFDMTIDDQKRWEKGEMLKPINLDETIVHIDAAPFQLVERTPLLKVHSLFSMGGIDHAYVTKIGRLVGVVALKEVRIYLISHEFNIYIKHKTIHICQLRKAIEDVNNGNLTSRSNQPQSEFPITPITPVSDPLLMRIDDKDVYHNTIISVDSLFQSSSECCSSNVEIDNLPKTK